MTPTKPSFTASDFTETAARGIVPTRMPIVLVELPVADASNANVPALIAACTSGLHSGKCVTEEAPDDARATAVAIVVWLDSGHLHARIDLGRRDEQRAGWQIRELTFHEQDAQPERWRSVGLAIAGIVGEATRPAPTLPSASPSAPRRPSTLQDRPRYVQRPWRIALGPTLESGLRGHALSAGAWLDLGRNCCAGLPFEVTLHAGNAWSLRSSAGVATRFSTLGLGVSGTLHPSSTWAVRTSLLGVAEAIVASSTDPATGAHASGTRWVYGWFARLQGIWHASTPLSGVLGLEMNGVSGATEVRSFERSVGVSPALRGGIQLGLEWEF